MAINAKRDQIVALKTAGVVNKKNVKHLKVCPKRVFYVWKQFQESSRASGKPIPCITRTVRIKTIISATKKNMEGNQQGNFGKFAKYAGISRFSMRRIFVYDLQWKKNSKKQWIQGISELSKQKRLGRGKLMLSGIQRDAGKIFIGSDQQMFMVEVMPVKQNENV